MHNLKFWTLDICHGIEDAQKTRSDSDASETIPDDVTEHARKAEEMPAHLDAWLTDAPEDATDIARTLGDIACAKGMTQVARDSGLSRESLYKALGENGDPSLATMLKVVKALGLRLHMEAG